MAKAFLMKLGEGSAPDSLHRTVAGLRMTVHEVKPGRFTLAGEGVFTGDDARKRVQDLALARVAWPMEFSFEDGERIRGQFRVIDVRYVGDKPDPSYCVLVESIGAPKRVEAGDA